MLMSLLVLVYSTGGLRSMKHFQNMAVTCWLQTPRITGLSKECGKGKKLKQHVVAWPSSENIWENRLGFFSVASVTEYKKMYVIFKKILMVTMFFSKTFSDSSKFFVMLIFEKNPTRCPPVSSFAWEVAISHRRVEVWGVGNEAGAVCCGLESCGLPPPHAHRTALKVCSGPESIPVSVAGHSSVFSCYSEMLQRVNVLLNTSWHML